jgi:hypothetical protein
MVNSITGSQQSSILAGISPQGTSPSGSTGSFTDQLAAALEGYLSQAGNASHLEIDIQTTQSQNSGVRQFIVTVKDPDSAPQQPNASPDATPAKALAADEPAPAAPMNEMDAYWAMQPPEVQKLRDIPDLADRSDLAQHLANQGYTIDKAIMVWGWDPLKTMQTRQMYGYTWGPSLNQNNVAVPGISFPGQTPYDPATPPPGSILVNTDFAKGLES